MNHRSHTWTPSHTWKFGNFKVKDFLNRTVITTVTKADGFALGFFFLCPPVFLLSSWPVSCETTNTSYRGCSFHKLIKKSVWSSAEDKRQKWKFLPRPNLVKVTTETLSFLQEFNTTLNSTNLISLKWTTLNEIFRSVKTPILCWQEWNESACRCLHQETDKRTEPLI